MNIATIIILLILVFAVSAIIAKMIRNKREGKGGCSCGCQGCPNSDICHSDKK